MIEVLTDTDALKITFERGTPDAAEAIVSFTGILHRLGGIETGEFARSIRNLDQTRDVYYVTDKTRSWYNSTYEEILATLMNHIGDRRVVVLGNSMGGFGALLLHTAIGRCNRAIAFVPQFSIHPDIAAFENRWLNFSSEITNWSHPTCVNGAEPWCEKQQYIFFGKQDVMDMQQLRLMTPYISYNSHVFLLAHCGHNVAQYIKSFGFLHSVLEEAISSDNAAARIANILGDAEIEFSYANKSNIDELRENLPVIR